MSAYLSARFALWCTSGCPVLCDRRTCHFDVLPSRFVRSVTPLRANHSVADNVPAFVRELIVHLTAIDYTVAAPFPGNALDHGEARRLALVLVEGAAEDAFTLK